MYIYTRHHQHMMKRKLWAGWKTKWAKIKRSSSGHQELEYIGFWWKRWKCTMYGFGKRNYRGELSIQICRRNKNDKIRCIENDRREMQTWDSIHPTYSLPKIQEQCKEVLYLPRSGCWFWSQFGSNEMRIILKKLRIDNNKKMLIWMDQWTTV